MEVECYRKRKTGNDNNLLPLYKLETLFLLTIMFNGNNFIFVNFV